MKLSKRSVRALLPRFLLFAGLIAVAFALTGAPATSASPDFTISISPSTAETVDGLPVNFTVTVTAENGFNGTVSFHPGGTIITACSAGWSFNPPSVTGSGSSTLTITPNCHTGTYTVNAVGESGTLAHGAQAKLIVGS